MLTLSAIDKFAIRPAIQNTHHVCINDLIRTPRSDREIRQVLAWLLTRKQLDAYGYVLSTVATDFLVLKHQAISNHRADWILIVLGDFMEMYYVYCQQRESIELLFEKKWPSCLKG